MHNAERERCKIRVSYIAAGLARRVSNLAGDGGFEIPWTALSGTFTKIHNAPGKPGG